MKILLIILRLFVLKSIVKNSSTFKSVDDMNRRERRLMSPLYVKS
jgi:hypothetical protein